jgi:hypothetical protein
MADAKFQAVGKCPKCGSENVEYGTSLLEGDSLGYKMTCKDCNCEAIEWYNLSYSETVIKK